MSESQDDIFHSNIPESPPTTKPSEKNPLEPESLSIAEKDPDKPAMSAEIGGILPTTSNYASKAARDPKIGQKPQNLDEVEPSAWRATFQPPLKTELDHKNYNRADQDDGLTLADMDNIDADWTLVLPDETNRRTSYLLMARACYDNGSSPFTKYPGLYEINGKSFRLSDLAAVIRRHTTMRRFAGYWAKTIYSLAILQNEPPAKWMKKGYSANTKYAAFDFFAALGSNTTPPPKEIPEIKPSDAEIAANLTAKQIQLARSTNKLRNLNPEVNGGGLCSPPPVRYSASSCS